MSNGPTPSGDSFDVRKIRRLASLMQEHDLSEIDVRQGTLRIRLQRGPRMVAGGAAWVPGLPAAGGAAAAAPIAAGAAPPPGVDERPAHLIRSPMVGTFYTSSSPDTPPFVKVGDHVSRDTTVCIVEAMKVFNEIQAEVSGQVVAVLVGNGEPVEYGQPLFKIATS